MSILIISYQSFPYNEHFKQLQKTLQTEALNQLKRVETERDEALLRISGMEAEHNQALDAIEEYEGMLAEHGQQFAAYEQEIQRLTCMVSFPGGVTGNQMFVITPQNLLCRTPGTCPCMESRSKILIGIAAGPGGAFQGDGSPAGGRHAPGGGGEGVWRAGGAAEYLGQRCRHLQAQCRVGDSGCRLCRRASTFVVFPRGTRSSLQMDVLAWCHRQGARFGGRGWTSWEGNLIA